MAVMVALMSLSTSQNGKYTPVSFSSCISLKKPSSMYFFDLHQLMSCSFTFSFGMEKGITLSGAIPPESRPFNITGLWQ